ncbi:sugar phosphate nucleotidyltransferase [Paenibacillus sp. PL2-23]|uniref:sugar phosphate nucleotidyltransferase n=1 Tax=Paenibacillus sp. PL2-23 TaxID=2100729 RepID=UPI0030F74727
MKILILASGMRERERRMSALPPSCLPILDGPDGGPESTLARLWRQLSTADLQDKTHIVAAGEHAAEIKRQLGVNMPIIIEPEHKGSYGATMAAAAYLYTVGGVTPNETIIVLSGDVYVEGDFFHCIRSLPKLLRESGSSVMLVGAEAEQPREGYGYIVPEIHTDAAEENAYDWRVNHYCKEPSEEEARQLMARGALRSCGVYAFRLELLLHRMSEAALPVYYDELCKHDVGLSVQDLEDALLMDAAIAQSCIRFDGICACLEHTKTETRTMAMSTNQTD